MVLFGGLWTRNNSGYESSVAEDISTVTSANTGRNKAVADSSIISGCATPDETKSLASTIPSGQLTPQNQQHPHQFTYGTLPQFPFQFGAGGVDHDSPSMSADYDDGSLDVLHICALYALTYVAIAIVAYSFVFEKWSIVDSVYFAVSTFTTVGYGDLEPSTVPGMLFTIVFAVYGVIILGIFIGIFGHYLSEGQAKAVKIMKRKRHKRIISVLLTEQTERQRKKEVQRIKDTFFSDHHSLLKDIIRVIKREAPEILFVMLLALILGIREGWSLTSTLYFCVMSASTTGFGDYTPRNEIDKVYCIFFLPLAVAVFGEVLGRIANVYIQRKARLREQAFLRRSITMCDLRRMDANQDGSVDMEEFLCFMLVALQKVDKETIQDLKDAFYSLDRNRNGQIDKEDLVDFTQTDGWNELLKLSEMQRSKQ